MSNNGQKLDQLSEFDLESNRLEDAVLGAVLSDPASIAELTVLPSDFYRPIERKVYRLILELVQAGKANAELISRSVLRELRAEPGYDAGWLASLIGRSHVEQAKTHDGPELKRLAKLRSLQRAGNRALQLKANPNELLQDLLPTESESGQALRPVSFDDLMTDHPQLRQPVIHGILRQGETANIIASPKTGKSFLAGGLAWSIASGQPWLSHDVEPGRVLILDNELHPETLASRLDHIAEKMEVQPSDRAGVDTICLRGLDAGVDTLSMLLNIEPGYYRLIVLDALYRSLPAGCNENDNAQMMRVYNHLDALAERWQSSIVIVHHSSKGQQGDKSLTDVGAGAGAISRAADTHIAIRPHETDGHFVLEAVTRSFKSPEPVSVKFDWPLWSATTLEPAIRQTRQKADQQQAADKQAMKEILEAIPALPKAIQQSRLREKFDFGVGRFNRLVGGLVRTKAVKTRRKAMGKQTFVYYSRQSNDSENDSGTIPNRN